jgi:hypothetical protein
MHLRPIETQFRVSKIYYSLHGIEFTKRLVTIAIELLKKQIEFIFQ